MINVQSQIGKNATSLMDGRKLYSIVQPLLEEKGSIQLSFKGVNFITSVFLNYSIGHLIKDYDRNQIKVTGLSKYQETLLESVLDAAEVTYGKVTH